MPSRSISEEDETDVSIVERLRGCIVESNEEGF